MTFSVRVGIFYPPNFDCFEKNGLFQQPRLVTTVIIGVSWAMEEIHHVVIPTLSKAKVSHDLSYPVGAAGVSAAVASTVQLNELKLHFYSGFDHGVRRGHYEFLRAEYLSSAVPAENWPLSSLYKRPPQYRWEIVVQPVPRVFRHRIHQFIIESALPQITNWLTDRAELIKQGSDILAFFYDEKTEEFIARSVTQLEPNRG